MGDLDDQSQKAAGHDLSVSLAFKLANHSITLHLSAILGGNCVWLQFWWLVPTMCVHSPSSPSSPWQWLHWMTLTFDLAFC